jgi:transposase
MLKIDFTEKNIDEVYQQFMDHPSGVTKKKLHVLYLKALGLAHKEIERIARTSADSVTRYLKDYNEGGLAALGVSRTHCPVSSLPSYQEQIKSHFQKQPPPYCSRGIP